MNKLIAQSIITNSSQIESVNFDEVLNKAYPDRTDLESIELSQINLSEFVYLSKRIMNQFLVSFNDREVSMVLPFQYTHGQFGNAQVDLQIQNYFTYLTQSNIPSAENILLWLIGYQIENGLYNKPVKKQNEILSAQLTSITEKINLTQNSVSNKQKEVESLFLELENSNKEITNLISQKKEELSQITNNLTTANTQAVQLSEILTRGTDQSSRLNTLLELQEEHKIQSDKKLAEIQAAYSITNVTLQDNIKNTTAQIVEFGKQVKENNGHLSFFESKKEFFEERINYLENLIGREVGVSLFETFKQRKNELEKPVIFWRWAVPAMTVAIIIWIFFIFSHQKDILATNLWWESFAVNTLKTIPAIFLLFFSINQYRKERNFQEEYAFKSTVALTIDAYSSRVSDLNNRDKLIMDAVLNIYKTPIEEKQNDKVNIKSTLDTIKSLAESTKEIIKGKG